MLTSAETGKSKACVFSTMRGVTPVMLRSFVSWHLSIGFDANIVFWDFESNNVLEERATCAEWDAMAAAEYSGRLDSRFVYSVL